MHGVGHRSRCLASAIDAALAAPNARSPPRGGLGGGFRLLNGVRVSPVQDDFLPPAFGPGIYRELPRYVPDGSSPHASPRRVARRPRRKMDIDAEPLGIDEARRRRAAVAAGGPSMTVEEVVASRIRQQPNQPPPPPPFLQQHVQYHEFQTQFNLQQQQKAQLQEQQRWERLPPDGESPPLRPHVAEADEPTSGSPRLPPLGPSGGSGGFMHEIDDTYTQMNKGGALQGCMSGLCNVETVQRLGRDPVTGLTPRWSAAGYPAGY